MRQRRKSKSAMSGLTFPVTRVKGRIKKKMGPGHRFTWMGAVYATAVMEYLTAEVMEIAGHVAKDFKVKRITNRHILLAILNDQELAKLLKGVTIPSGGVLPKIEPSLLKNVGQKTTPTTFGAAVQRAKVVVTKGKTVTAAAKKPQATKRGKQLQAGKKKPAAKSTASDRAGQGITILNERVLLNGQRLTVISGDIVNVKADALVVPSDFGFSLGGQVGQRLSQVGGADFLANVSAAAQRESLTSNTAALCEGENFCADSVIFCNGPYWNNAASAIPDLEKTVVNCFKVADKEKLTSICLPSIGSGVAKFPKQTAAQTILRTISEYFKATPKSGIDQVYFVLYDQQSINIYVTELGRLQE